MMLGLELTTVVVVIVGVLFVAWKQGVFKNLKKWGTMKQEYQGRQIEVEESEVLSNNEPWSEYKFGKWLCIYI